MRKNRALLVFLCSTLVCGSLVPSARADDIRVSPDEDGNFTLSANRGKKLFKVKKGDRLIFEQLSRNDQVIEVGAKKVAGDKLCSDAELSGKKPHKVPKQDPLPPGLHPKKELSGPYHTFPAGIIALSPGSDECGYFETVDSACPANMTEKSEETFDHGGHTYRLCQTSETSVPPCEKGKILESVWANPGVQGVFLRIDWKDVNPGYNRYNWENLNREFARAVRHGKTISLGIRTGGNSIPDWIFDTGQNGANKAQRVILKDWGSGDSDLPEPNCGLVYVVASPADANFRRYFMKMLEDLGKNIRADQRRFSVLNGVKVTGMGQQTLENRLPTRCNIAVRRDGDGPLEGHLVDLSGSMDMNSIEYIEDYIGVTISRRDRCICNPQALKDANYTPTALYEFYKEVSQTLQRAFGYKQKIFMNITQGFPQIGESGRFLGDHLDRYVFDPDVPFDPASDTLHPRVQLLADGRAKAGSSEYPGPGEQTKRIIDDARDPANFGGNADAIYGWGVENAALNQLPLDLQGGRCSQQTGIDVTPGSPFNGSAQFPITGDPSTKSPAVDDETVGCPNKPATEEGIYYGRVTGFQVRNTLVGAEQLDSALWNMTLNSNAVFFEAYEDDLWRANIETENGNLPLDSTPSIRTDSISNAASATAKTLFGWNELLLFRARALANGKNITFLKDPHPSSYVVKIPGGSTERYFFNSRACDAFLEANIPLRVNKVKINP